jgi:NADH dehydrogenase [ubiquinone] 1 alpha subcomplex assembly factor 7
MTPLEREIRSIIETEGPIPVDIYMLLCMGHPRRGYYPTRDPFGKRGDFITAPEISQMFGELIGAWVATVWQQMGRPRDLKLVELGPGRGTLMADALRATRPVSGFHDALSIHLVETSPVLRARQKETLPKDIAVAWHETVEAVPNGPSISVANEFVDALPVRQFVKDRDGWHMRMVGIVDDKLSFVAMPEPAHDFVGDNYRPHIGAILEWHYDRPVAMLAQRIARQGGAALIIDYGHTKTGFGDTLQAVRKHKFADPLVDPGEADLTAQVDFEAVSEWATRQGAATHGPVTQGEFLRRLGIADRAARLKRNATPPQAADIDAALKRLTAGDQMGDLFKVLAIADPKLGPLPGFDS